MTLRQARGREQDRGHLALPGEPASPDPLALALRYAVRSDVGLLREGNEDSAYAGPHLLAVADGMGGHAAGEVASAATITTIAPLDAEEPGPDLVGALAGAVATASLRLQELIISDPAIEGMGTTLTALLWVKGYAALCHIGDSRAYLLRDGQFVQITHDHTLVQSLVDEGQITEDNVATHPYRSLLLRALDGRTISKPDLTPLETYPGDRYLLCSDGLSGVVSEQTLHQTLASVRDLDKVTLRLVGLAIKGGGPDNITCIVADVIDAHGIRVPPRLQPVFAGAAVGGAQADLSRRQGGFPGDRGRAAEPAGEGAIAGWQPWSHKSAGRCCCCGTPSRPGPMCPIMSGHWPAAASGTHRSWGAGCEPPATSRTGSCAPPPAGQPRRGSWRNPRWGPPRRPSSMTASTMPARRSSSM